MPKQYACLAEVTVGAGGASSISFSSISSAYTDLCVKLSIRSSSTSVNIGYYDTILIRLNNSTANYSYKELYSYNNTIGSTTNTTTTSTNATGIWGRLTGVGINNSGSTTSTFSSGEFYLPNYTSNIYKSHSLDFVEEQNQSANCSGLISGLWSDTSSVTSISFALKDGSFVQYSTATLYGITNS